MSERAENRSGIAHLLPTRPGLVNTACLPCLSATLKSTHYCATHIHMSVRLRRLRASRSEAACGIDGQELAAHADRYLLASQFVVASITTAWLVAASSRPAAGISRVCLWLTTRILGSRYHGHEGYTWINIAAESVLTAMANEFSSWRHVMSSLWPRARDAKEEKWPLKHTMAR